jgi:hypothetical protein
LSASFRSSPCQTSTLLSPGIDGWALRAELDEPAGYGFAERGAVQLHLQPDDPDDPEGRGLVYIRVSDAEALHAAWASAGVESRFMGPHNSPYGLREFVYTDPDGIVHKVGSPLGPREPGPGAPI